MSTELRLYEFGLADAWYNKQISVSVVNCLPKKKLNIVYIYIKKIYKKKFTYKCYQKLRFCIYTKGSLIYPMQFMA